MRQLSALDVQFLNAESATTTGHVGGLSILDPSTAPRGLVTVEDIRALIAKRLHLAGPLHWRLLEVPLNLDHPYWVEDTDFDLEFHVREIALPAPGNEQQLAEQVARIAARPLDRRRPLWEAYLIQGLEHGRIALYTKVHHAAIDGVSGAELLGVLMDLTPEPRHVDPPDSRQVEGPPPTLSLLATAARRLALQPVKIALSVPKMLPHLGELPGAARIPGAAALAKATGKLARAARLGPGRHEAERPVLVPPDTPFNGPITQHRRFAYGSLPLDEVKRIKNTFGYTVNDVVMALCAGALHRWLAEHQAIPATPLVTLVPLSVRTPQQAGSAGNQISVLQAPLPVHIADPKARLDEVVSAMATAKQRYRPLPASWLVDFSAMLPAALGALSARALMKFAGATSPLVNLVISNVPGVQMPLYTAGAKLLGHYPVSAITDASGGINITAMSYDGKLDFGIVVCRELVPDVWSLIDYLRDALDELGKLADEEGAR
ncbi:wax ester/triacylglycerol synthase family O-acyltransferase [Amycolatopsis sp. YIM 10]|uniref:WS/DGAT/MGAT family O-acyltransferase n=1 Tax=Amycolatopsis sp. YIM 10 TaxID=2653857 RepID=UPI001290035F|nr:wax ester/triacylglycerol synthase family O-acyltransferase [Amycolatopsis sp. YIM 10]QFU92249.1 Putative diacylglycerol O-acyltransferase [Amycolatopsis sp. YIM 10]